MGWLWGGGDSAQKDKLDPSLRDFLDKEAPAGPKPALPAKAAPPPKPYDAPKAAPAPQTTSEAPKVPPQSQFQDGRYADLWKNYTPQHVIDARGKSDQDKLKDIIDGYNDRKSSIGRVAMENCALEYMEQFECYMRPSWYQMGTVCRKEQKQFNKCYDIQSKFLKALGYMTMDARSPEEDERIQMHADKLYQQLLEQERLLEEAKAQGKPIPRFESVLSKQNIAKARPQSGQSETDDDIWKHIKPESRKMYEDNLKKLAPEEQEFERKALEGELRAQTGITKQLEDAFVQERVDRMKRREAGQSTVGDAIKWMWGWK